MTNVEKLQELRCLGEVRQRAGAKDAKDTSHDEHINGLTNSQLVEHYCGWHLGDGDWWCAFKQMFDEFELMDEGD